MPIVLNKPKLILDSSYTEGLLNIVPVTMACETPVLAKKIGTTDDIVINNYSRILMKTNDPSVIANNIYYNFNQAKENIESIIRNGRKLVEENYPFETVLKKLNLFINETMKL